MRAPLIAALLLAALPAFAIDALDEAYSQAISTRKSKEGPATVIAAAQKGDVKAMRYMAWILISGNTAPVDKAGAVRWLTAAAEKGDVEAQRSLAEWHLVAQAGLKADPAATLGWYRKAAAQGDVPAQLALASMLREGRGTAKDPAAAAEVYLSAAKGGNAEAMYRLCEMRTRGEGVKKNFVEAYAWCLESSESGHDAAKTTLGILGSVLSPAQISKGEALADERGDPLGKAYRAQSAGDHVRAVALARKAAERENVEAQFFLANAYYQGQGVPRDMKETLRWYERAAENGHTQSMISLASLYRNGAEGLFKDPLQAAVWYRKAAKRGNGFAFHALALMHLEGEGVPKDARKAADLLREGAKGGDAACAFTLGLFHLRGVAGIPKNAAVAAPLLRQAAERNHSDAWSLVGDLLRDGTGVAKDTAGAITAYKQSVKFKDPAGLTGLAGLLESGAGPLSDPAKSRELYLEAARGDRMLKEFAAAAAAGRREPYTWLAERRSAAQLTARRRLGFQYYEGIGGAKDYVESWAWFEAAARKGDKESASMRDTVAAKLDLAGAGAARKRADEIQPEVRRVDRTDINWDRLTPQGTAVIPIGD